MINGFKIKMKQYTFNFGKYFILDALNLIDN